MNNITECVGKSATYSRTVGESDVYLFGGISGDMHQNHYDESFMGRTVYQHRIAHGMLVASYMSTAGSLLNEQMKWNTVSYGYDRIRFIKPVFIGDTLTCTETVTRVDDDGKYFADVTATNQNGVLVAVAIHVSKFIAVKDAEEPSAPQGQENA